MPIKNWRLLGCTCIFFLPGSQGKVGQIPGKITALGEVETHAVQSALALCRAKAVPNLIQGQAIKKPKFSD